MTITSTDLQAALASAGLPGDSYELSAEGAHLMTSPTHTLDQTHVCLTVTPDVYDRLRGEGWQEVAAGYLGHGILLVGTQRPQAASAASRAPDEARPGHARVGYSSAFAFAGHALVRTRAAGRRAGEQRFGWSAWIVAVIVLAIDTVARPVSHADGTVGVAADIAGAVIGSLGLLLIVAVVVWLVRLLCGSRRMGVAHGRSLAAAVTQTVVATAPPVLLAELCVVLLGGAGRAVGTLLTLGAIVITVLLTSSMFRVSIGRALLAVIGADAALIVAGAALAVVVSFATR